MTHAPPRPAAPERLQTLPTPQTPLGVSLAGLDFQNPVVLASGTAAYGREIAGVIDLEALGGIVTKAVSLRPRHGNPAPRVAEFPGGMLNAIGLANPGLEEARRSELPWLRENLRRARVLVNVVGDSVDDYEAVVAGLEEVEGIAALELNVSCPNVKAGGMEFGADPCVLGELVRRARAATRRTILVKLSPTLGDIAAAAATAMEAGADAISLVNTIPGLAIDVERRRPILGFGSGGVSGHALLPVGVLATWKVHRAVGCPIVGVGGVARASDALQYILAGATLVGIGTAAMRDPRAPERVVRGLAEWCERHGVRVAEMVGALEWPR
jgi:dihydroorotate dehydrogenase (NAD+) catalytic subunit